MKLLAILGGGDWVDASVEHIVAEDDIDLSILKDTYKTWYHDIYIPGKVPFMSFAEWLIFKGHARKAIDGIDYIEYWED